MSTDSSRVGDDRRPESPETAAAEPEDAAGPWRPGIATGIGSLPGTDPAQAARCVAGELADLVHLAELPARGAGADMIGRTAALLVDIAAEVVPTGWRLARRPGRDLRRAKDYLAFDLDAAAEEYAGAGWVKVQACGPWTLAAETELPSGHRALTDRGAVDDLASSLAEGVASHAAELSRRIPGAGIVVQLDEPRLPAVLSGSLPTASGWGTVRAVDRQRASDVLAEVAAALAEYPLVAHCCHPGAPVALLRGAGFGALALDITAVGESAATLDPIGEALEAGTVLLAGLVPATAPNGPAPSLRALADPLLALWGRLGLDRRRLAEVVPTPVCGLAAASPDWAVTGMRTATELGRALREPPESW